MPADAARIRRSGCEELGYGRPEVEEVNVGIGYTTRLYRRLPSDLDGDMGALLAPRPPQEKRIGFMLAMEGDRWIVTLGGWLGNHAPTDPDGFLEFARSLVRPDIYDVIKHAEPLTHAVTYSFPSNLRRRYERFTKFPGNYLVMGDALCSFNPLYGQGMSVATLEALALRDCLEHASSVRDVWRPFFKAGRQDHRRPVDDRRRKRLRVRGRDRPGAAGARGSSIGISTASTRPRRPTVTSAGRSSTWRTCWRPRRHCSGRRSWRACGASAWRCAGRWRSSRIGRSRRAASGCSRRTETMLSAESLNS